MRPERRLSALGLALLLAACQTPAPAPEPPPPAEPVCPAPAPPPEAKALEAVLAYAEDLRKALALSQGRSSADLAQAAAQMEQAASAPEPLAAPLQPLAALLAARLAEQRRLQDGVDKLTQQLRDTQRRNEQLNEKLEALKAIEQTLPGKPGTPR